MGARVYGGDGRARSSVPCVSAANSLAGSRARGHHPFSISGIKTLCTRGLGVSVRVLVRVGVGTDVGQEVRVSNSGGVNVGVLAGRSVRMGVGVLVGSDVRVSVGVTLPEGYTTYAAQRPTFETP